LQNFKAFQRWVLPTVPQGGEVASAAAPGEVSRPNLGTCRSQNHKYLLTDSMVTVVH